MVIICALCIDNDEGYEFLLLILLCTVTMSIAIYVYKNTIFPIDVYRGNTTLEITYKDDVAIDSTVVWKNK